MKTRTLTIVLIIAALGIALVAYALSGRESVGAARTFNLTQFGIALEIPGSLSKLTSVGRDESETGPGEVLHMYGSTQCDLGALYEIQKNAITQSKTSWTAETLERFQLPQGEKPAQVKEFTDFYLVFEPNPDLCATEAKQKDTEMREQKDLWNALSSAHFMQ